MALGDSISAGLFAKSTREGPLSRPSPPPPSLHVADEQQLPLGSKPILSSLIAIDEYRGVSYPTGNDPGAITIASILSRYSPNLTGVSTGHHPPITCVGPVCQRPEGDGLNVAVSGSLSASLLGQVRDYLIPTIEAMDLNREDWKYVNLGDRG